jgi:hypothetical protein
LHGRLASTRRRSGLIGHLHAAHLEALQAQLEGNGPRTVLDLDQVTLVDVEVVRFLGGCEAAGIAILHGPPYIREWIRREQARPGEVVREDYRGGTRRTAVNRTVEARQSLTVRDPRVALGLTKVIGRQRRGEGWE